MIHWRPHIGFSEPSCPPSAADHARANAASKRADERRREEPSYNGPDHAASKRAPKLAAKPSVVAKGVRP